MGDAAGPVERFQEYLRIKTVQPHPDYGKLYDFLNVLFYL